MKNLKKILGVFSCVAVALAASASLAYTTTTNYSFKKPAVNDPVDADQWGTYLNENFDSIDSLMPSMSANNTFGGTNTFSAVTTFSADIKVIDSINDTNNNEVIKLGTTASAVNEVTITNAATGNAPVISATGGDTNINLNFLTKGTGVYNFSATASQGTTVRFYEDTDNGSNYVGLKAADTLSGNVEFTLPSADGTSGQVVQTNGSGVLSFTTITQPDSDRLVSFFARFDGTAGSPTVADGYNVTSITKNGTGDYTINFTSTLSSANYAAIAMGAANTMPSFTATAPTTSAVRVQFKADDGGLTDCSYCSVVGFGGN